MSSVRQQVNIAVSPRVVWRALTTEEGVTSWWVDQARLDARPGGRLVLTSVGDDGQPVEERGMFHEVRPTRKVEIAWDSVSPAPTKGTRIEFLIARDGDETRLSVVHSGAGILDDEAARAVLDQQWRQALHALRDHLEAAKDEVSAAD
jgi:uncharacterized protein YndB with AHSA1/START domain